MFRFIHTADLHIGMAASGLGEAGGRVRAARLESLEKLLEIARDADAHAILIAGDLFDDNQVDPDQVEKAAGLLNDRSAIPTYIVPGNHDPYTRDSVFRRPIWGQLKPHIHVLTQPEPVELGPDAILYPCPLARKNGAEDPTLWIPPRHGESIRIGMAHGSMKIRPDVGDDDFPIPLETAATRQLDYLALGHWHSRLSHPFDNAQARTWYCGSHETTKFGEAGSGSALSVTLEENDSPPAVEPIDCGVLTWCDRTVDLSCASLTDVMRELREMPGAETTLLRMRLTGRMPADEPVTVDDLRRAAENRFLACRIDATQLVPPRVEEGLDDLLASPYLIETARALEQIAAEPSASNPDTTPHAATRALEILQEIAWQQRQGSNA